MKYLEFSEISTTEALSLATKLISPLDEDCFAEAIEFAKKMKCGEPKDEGLFLLPD